MHYMSFLYTGWSTYFLQNQAELPGGFPLHIPLHLLKNIYMQDKKIMYGLIQKEKPEDKQLNRYIKPYQKWFMRTSIFMNFWWLLILSVWAVQEK